LIKAGTSAGREGTMTELSSETIETLMNPIADLTISRFGEVKKTTRVSTSSAR
jgi:hypothetical protein